MDINLATKTIGRVKSTQRAKNLLDKLIIWGAVVLSLVLLVVAGLNLTVNRSNQALDKRITSVKKQIEAKAKIENQQVYLNSKLASFGGLVASHEIHQKVADTVFNLIPSGTSLKGFAVTDTGTINLSGSVPGWAVLSRLLANLDYSGGPLTVTSSKIKQVNFSADGGVNFDLELTLKL